MDLGVKCNGKSFGAARHPPPPPGSLSSLVGWRTLRAFRRRGGPCRTRRAAELSTRTLKRESRAGPCRRRRCPRARGREEAPSARCGWSGRTRARVGCFAEHSDRGVVLDQAGRDERRGGRLLELRRGQCCSFKRGRGQSFGRLDRAIRSEHQSSVLPEYQNRRVELDASTNQFIKCIQHCSCLCIHRLCSRCRQQQQFLSRHRLRSEHDGPSCPVRLRKIFWLDSAARSDVRANVLPKYRHRRDELESSRVLHVCSRWRRDRGVVCLHLCNGLSFCRFHY